MKIIKSNLKDMFNFKNMEYISMHLIATMLFATITYLFLLANGLNKEGVLLILITTVCFALFLKNNLTKKN